MKAQGRIEDGVIIDEVGPANRLYSKGFPGTPQPGNGLKLSYIEAAYAQQERRLETPLSLAGLLHAAGPRGEVDFLVYRDLRERGLVTRHNEEGFTVWARSDGPKDAPWFHCTPHDERTPLDPANLDEGVLSVADSDGVVTHYWSTPADPRGDCPLTDPEPMQGTLLENRVLVKGEAPESMGTPLGDHTALSKVEAASLHKRGLLDVTIQASHLETYEDLRSRGVITKSGFRFGTHFRGYETDPGKCHAQWLIQCPNGNMDWSDVSRAIRLAHGVKKDYLIAHNGYWHLSWFRP